MHVHCHVLHIILCLYCMGGVLVVVGRVGLVTTPDITFGVLYYACALGFFVCLSLCLPICLYTLLISFSLSLSLSLFQIPVSPPDQDSHDPVLMSRVPDMHWVTADHHQTSSRASPSGLPSNGEGRVPSDSWYQTDSDDYSKGRYCKNCKVGARTCGEWVWFINGY